MRRSMRVAILSASCFLAASCVRTIKIEPENLLETHPDWFACDRMSGDNRPDLPAPYVIDWSSVLVPGDAEMTLERAKAEQEAFAARVYDRNGVVAGYILNLEGANFTCWNSLQTQRDYYRNRDLMD